MSKRVKEKTGVQTGHQKEGRHTNSPGDIEAKNPSKGTENQAICKEKQFKFFRQNKIFKEDAKKFYRELDKKKIDVEEPPPIEDIEKFWSKIWENETKHNKNCCLNP